MSLPPRCPLCRAAGLVPYDDGKGKRCASLLVCPGCCRVFRKGPEASESPESASPEETDGRTSTPGKQHSEARAASVPPQGTA